MEIAALTADLFKRGAPFVPIYTSIPFATSDGPNTVAMLRALVASPLAESGKVFFLQRSAVHGGAMRNVECLLSFSPFESLYAQGNQTRIENADGATSVAGNPFEVLAQRLQKYTLPDDTTIESFFGAALGYFSYDASRFLEPVLTKTRGNLAELSGAPQHCDAEFMFFRKRIVVDYIGKRILFATGVFPRGDQTPGHLRHLVETATAEIEAIRALFLASQTSVSASRSADETDDRRELPVESMRPMLGKAGFIEGVKKLKNHIRAGDIFQAVLSEQLTVPFAADPLDLFATLSRINPSPYEFYFATGRRIVLGSSPEMLLKIDGKRLETHPIAGTRPTSPDPAQERKYEEQLLRSEKEKAEHLMLVDLARNDIGRVSEPGRVSVDSFMQLKKFGSVMHLVSRVNGSLRAGIGSIAALGSCFPAGTLSGAPKVRAMQLLSEIEPTPRGFYGGAVVAASLNGDLDSCIAIRSVRIEDGHATVQAGAGVVADSRPESEYLEVVHKTRMMRRALALVGVNP